uniref:DUF4139 domain-containing protein n=1 Tax=Panagrolaimus superbus TaxID=310955 RepID=A0A914YVC2_9BILA
MQLSYFGNIVQESDEDWNDVDLFLSTAQPCLEGNLPKSEATFIRFHRSPPPKYAKPYSRESIREGTKCRAKRARFRPSECFRDSQTSPAYGATSPVPQKLQQMTTIAEENILSTTFTIPNKKSIPTNSTKHKVTITVETFQAYLHYHCVPKKDINVYLMATVINNSDYPILAGPATIYVNNSLSATIKLNSISCGEKMECPLGVDKQVKVVYKPSKIFQSQNGIINKSSISTSEQRIIVKNNKRDEPIHLTIHEGIPQSSDERIQIQLLSPDMLSKNNSVIKPYFAAEGCQRIQLPSVGIEMDDLNNLLWTEMIKAEEEKEFKIKWSIDFPNDKTLEYFKYDQEEHQKSFSISDSE